MKPKTPGHFLFEEARKKRETTHNNGGHWEWTDPTEQALFEALARAPRGHPAHSEAVKSAQGWLVPSFESFYVIR